MSAPSGQVPALELRDVFKIYREGSVETVALRGAWLSVAPGEFVAVMGPSGSGKSTLIGLAAGLMAPTAGQVLVNGQPISASTEPERAALRRRRLGIVFSGTYNTKAATAGAGETAAVSLGVYAFLGPLLTWAGAALLVRRAVDGFLARPARRWHGGLGGLVERSLRRRQGQSAAAVLVTVMGLSFGLASTVFGATYEASRRADARYLVGSDLRVTPALTAPQPAVFGEQLRVAGVRAVAPVFVSHDVLVGSQTQTVYGIDVPSLEAAATIQDGFFVGATAPAALDRLRGRPDGLLVSEELAAAYNLQIGDTVAMRVPTRSGAYADVAPTVVAVFTIFPTSSQNSDLVVNSTFLAAATGNPDPGFFLVRTDGRPATNATVAASLAERFKDRLALRVETADQALSQDQSSLAGVNLAGLVALDRLYAALVVALGLGIFLVGSILERKRELGTLQAVGATRRQVIWLLLGEGLVLAAAGLAGGLVIGVALAWQYNGFLAGIFAVPRPVVEVPISELGLLLRHVAAAVGAAAIVGAWRLRGVWPAEVLRDV